MFQFFNVYKNAEYHESVKKVNGNNTIDTIDLI